MVFVVRFTCALVILFATAVTTIEAAPSDHPSYGHPTNSPRPRHPRATPIPAEWSQRDIVFPGRRKAWEELSAAERYITRGTRSSSLLGGPALMPWSLAIYSIVNEYYRLNGAIPDVLSDEVLRSGIPRLKDAEPKALNEFRNPITGKWPRLKAAEFSPGDVYIRPLDPAERVYYSRLNRSYEMDWHPSRLKVFYLRVYGEEDIIIANFMYAMSR